MLTALGIIVGLALFVLANLITAGATRDYADSLRKPHERGD